ncbi:hypothetical protein MRX96_034924 [Rhipicephalus microplus]
MPYTTQASYQQAPDFPASRSYGAAQTGYPLNGPTGYLASWPGASTSGDSQTVHGPLSSKRPGCGNLGVSHRRTPTPVAKFTTAVLAKFSYMTKQNKIFGLLDITVYSLGIIIAKGGCQRVDRSCSRATRLGDLEPAGGLEGHR